MNLAIVADWLPVYAGAEHVIAQMHALWPDAPIFTTVAKRSALGPLQNADIRTTALQKWYALTGNHQWLLSHMPAAIESIDLRGYDVIVSSSHAVGKGIIPPGNARHICYCHTPMRYAWEMQEEYLEDFHVPQFLRRMIRDKLKDIRRWDLTTAKRVDTFIANSTTTQERIKRIYNRESMVIHPPVSDVFFQYPLSTVPSPPQGRGVPEGRGEGDYFLAIGRLVPYKRYDLLIEACNRLRLPLKIAGAGKDFARLKALAGPTVTMLGFVDEQDLPALYGNAKALLFAAFEDAGVVALEAQACGTPVIAYGKGGALDTVVEGETGMFFQEQTVDAVFDAMLRFQTMSFDPVRIREHARQVSVEQFRKKLLHVVEKRKG